MSLTYDTWVSQLANLMVIGSTDANFLTFLPGCRDYAEQRIYRELDLLNNEATDSTTPASSGLRTFTLPSANGTFVVVDQINVITPAGQAALAGTRNPVVPVSRDFVDAVYPSGQNNTGIPQFYAMDGTGTIIFGPSPDAPYVVEVIGTRRPTALSSANTETWLSQNLPDLFMAASMVFASAYMRDFGAQADNPSLSASWEQQYQILKASALAEEVRKKYEGAAWTSQPAAATPQRV